MQNTNTAKHS